MFGIYATLHDRREFLFTADTLEEASHIIDVARDENRILLRVIIIAEGVKSRHVYTDRHWESLAGFQRDRS